MSWLHFRFLVAFFAASYCPARTEAAPSRSTLKLNRNVTLDIVAIPNSPALWMGRTPVTVAQFRVFVEETRYRTDAENPEGNGPGRVGGHGWDAQDHRFAGWLPQYTWRHTGWALTDEHPVSNISWNDASAFCKWLSAKTGRHVRLPTDFEFETAMRANAASAYFTGNSPASLEGYANVADRSLQRAVGEQITALAGFRLMTDFRSRRRWGSLSPTLWDCTTCLATFSSGVLLWVFHGRVVVLTTMGLRSVVKKLANGTPKRTAGTLTSASG